MYGTIGQLVWRITGDNSGLKKALSDSETAASKTGKTFSGIGGVIAKAFAVGAVVAFGKSLAQAASDATETSQKFGVIFSSIQDQAREAAKVLQQEFGFTAVGAQELLAGTGNLLEGLGYTQEEALKMSGSIAQLGSDLTSMNNYAGGAAEATRILTKALLGERDALQALDLKITDDQLRAYAKSLGKVWDQLTQAEKAQLTYNAILAQAGNAIGDNERSVGSAAQTWRRLESLWEDVKVTLGNELLPGLVNLGTTLLETAKDAGPIMEALKGIVNLAGKVATNIGIVINLFAQFKRTADALSAMSDREDAEKEHINQLKYYRAKYESEMRARNMTLAQILKEREHSGELAYLEKLKAAAAEAIDSERTALEEYRAGQERIAQSYDDTTGAINRQVSARTRERQAAQKAAEAQIRLAGTQTTGTAATTAQKKEMEELTQTLLQHGAALQTRAELDTYINQLEIKANEAAIKGEEKKAAAIRKAIAALKEQAELLEKTWQGLSDRDKLNTINSAFQGIGNGVISVLQSAQQLTEQLYQNRLSALDAQMEAELEAAGVAEDTAVETAQKEYDEAVAGGDAQLIEEKRKALERAKIEEKYQKKRRQLEYESNMAAWQFQVAQASIQAMMAPLNAYTSTLAIPVVGPALAPVAAALAATAAGLMMAAVIEAKPQPPAYATGGIVPGNSFTGDQVSARVNSGEMILNADQQARLFEIANGGASNQRYMQVPAMSESSLWDLIFKASKNGDLLIAERAVTTR